VQRSEYEGKFRGNASRVLEKQNVEKVIEIVDHFEDLPEARVFDRCSQVK